MKTILMPYHKGRIELTVDEKNLLAILQPSLEKADDNQQQKVIAALESPVDSQRLSEKARGKKKAIIITSDHTRSVPSKITLPLLLEEIRRYNSDISVDILIATGLHRATTDKEMRLMFGDEIVDKESIIVHDAFVKEQMEFICTLPSGASFEVNRLALECDLLVMEGFIEPHLFAGFSGGRKSILPGISSEKTIKENHSAPAIASNFAKSGILNNNPIHQDMVYAAAKMDIAFILNVTLDEDKKIQSAFAGDYIKAHEAGCEYLISQSRCKAVMADIVVTTNGGFPLDQNLYQTPKSVTTAVETVKEGGVIILASACSDGVGGEHFSRLMKIGTPKEIYDKLMAIPPKETIEEQWCVQLYAKILLRNKIILVTDGIPPQEIEEMNLIPAKDLGEAMKIAYEIMGEDASVTVIPDGVSVILK